MEVVLYSTHCPHCGQLEQLLKIKKINYSIIDDNDTIINFAKEHELKSAPFITVDNDKIMTFEEARKWIKEQ